VGEARTGRGLQRLLHPGDEVGECHAAPGRRESFELRPVDLRQAQRQHHLCAGRVLFELRPLAGGLQQPAQVIEPLRQRAHGLHAFTPFVHALQQRQLAVTQVARAKRSPIADAGTPHPALHCEDRAGRMRRRILEPVDHGVGARVPGASAQGQQHVRRGSCGRQRPAGFVADGGAGLLENRADAPGEDPVDRRERDGRSPFPHMTQHAGSRALGLVGRVLRLMQGNHASRCAGGQVQGLRSRAETRSDRFG
jgi:hypothetical protein